MNKANNESGFSALEVLLILVVIGLLAGIGWYVWYNRTAKTTNTSTTSSNASSNSTPKTSKPANYFTVKEWGVRAPYDGALTLQYTAAIGSSTDMALSSEQLANGGPEVCKSVSSAEAGILSRYLPTDTDLGPGVPASETAQQYVDQNASTPHAKVGNYIYIYWGNNYLKNGSYDGPCADKTAAVQTIEAFSNVTTKLQAVE